MRDARITLVSMSAALKNPRDFIFLPDDFSGIFVFSGEVDFSNSANLGTHFRRKHWGIQRGMSPWLWVSNRGKQHPVGTRFCSQSLVCYTFGDRGRLKGAVRRRNGHFVLAGYRWCGGMERICEAEPWNGAASPGDRKVYKTRRSDVT